MKFSRAERFRLYATADQEALFARFAGTCRFVYNLALKQPRDWALMSRSQSGRIGMAMGEMVADCSFGTHARCVY